MATLKEIADAAGVSVNTVSRALSGKNKETWESSVRRAAQIRRIARRLNYRPHASATTLRRGRTNTIGILLRNGIPSVLHGGWVAFEYVAGVVDRLGAHDFKTLLVRDRELTGPGEQPAKLPLLFREHCIDGLVVTHGASPMIAEAITSLEVPVVWLDAGRDEPQGCVMRDEANAARVAIDRLVELGHRHIVYACHPRERRPAATDDNLPIHHSMMQRRSGYEAAMLHHGLAPSYMDADGHLENLPLLGEQLENNREATAYVCYSVGEAFWLNRASEMRGFRVLDCASVIALDETLSAEPLWRDLGRVTFDRYSMGDLAAEMMLKTLETSEFQPSQRIANHSIVGSTFGPPAACTGSTS